jgi:hypothetical protein
MSENVARISKMAERTGWPGTSRMTANVSTRGETDFVRSTSYELRERRPSETCTTRPISPAVEFLTPAKKGKMYQRARGLC